MTIIMIRTKEECPDLVGADELRRNGGGGVEMEQGKDLISFLVGKV